MRCVLHIGTEKTGTTLLQDWLYQNKQSLSHQRIFLSDLIGKNNNRRLVGYFQSGFDDWTRVRHLTSQEEKDIFFAGFLDNFAAEIESASADHDVCVISSEHFHSRLRKREDIEALQHYLQQVFESVRVVCYFREQMRMAQSFYSTALRGNCVVSREQFLDAVTPTNYYYNFKEIADNWSGVFGRGNCEFRVYDRNKFKEQDIRKDFLDCLDCSHDVGKLDLTTNSSNESLSRLEGELYRATNIHVPLWKEGQKDLDPENLNIKKWISLVKGIRQGSLTDPGIAEVSGRFVESNQAFFDEYFGGEYLFSKLTGNTTKADSAMSFTLSQVAALMEGLLKALVLNRLNENVLSDSDAEWLRDIGLKFERDQTLTLADAANLMGLAGKIRPECAFIRKKTDEYTDKLTKAA